MSIDLAARPAAQSLVVKVMRLLRQVTFQTIAGYFLVMTVAFLLLGLGQATFGDIHNSVWDWAAVSPKYFNVAVGIMLTPVALTTLVAHGVTRRTFAIAGSVFLVAVAAGTSLFWALAYLVEHAIFSVADLPQTLTSFHVFHTPTQTGLVLAEYFPLILAHQTTGWLLGTSFTRFGLWGGIAFLPVALLPVAITEMLLLTQWIGELFIENEGLHRWPLGIGVPLTLLACAAGLYLNYLLLRPIRLKPARG